MRHWGLERWEPDSMVNLKELLPTLKAELRAERAMTMLSYAGDRSSDGEV